MIKFKLIHENAKMPTRAKPGDAGFDLTSVESAYIPPGARYAVSTGIRCSIPADGVGIIKPRSGLAVKHGIDVLAGVIDSSYRGELLVVLQNHGDRTFDIYEGDRIAQMVVTYYIGEAIQVDELDDTDRGNGGFGHTGS